MFMTCRVWKNPNRGIDSGWQQHSSDQCQLHPICLSSGKLSSEHPNRQTMQSFLPWIVNYHRYQMATHVQSGTSQQLHPWTTIIFIFNHIRLNFKCFWVVLQSPLTLMTCEQTQFMQGTQKTNQRSRISGVHFPALTMSSV